MLRLSSKGRRLNNARWCLMGVHRSRVTGLGVNGLASESVSIDPRGNATTNRVFRNRASAEEIAWVKYPTSTTPAVTTSTNGLVRSSTSQTGVTTTFAYDAFQREVSQTDGRGNTTRTVYDSLGRVSSTIDALGYATAYGYDALGRQTSVTDPLTNTVTTAYDADGRVVAQRGATYPVDYFYDEFGDKVSMTTYRNAGGPGFVPAAGDTTRWLRDEATGLVTNKVYADDSIVTYTYTPDGLLLRETKPSGVWGESVYDTARQTVGMISSDAVQGAITQRDRLGRVTAKSNSVAFAEYYLDDFLGVTNEVQTVDAISVSFEREFDAYGRIVRFARVGGEESMFGYAPHGAISAVSNGNVAVEYAFTSDALDAGYVLAVQSGADFSREVFRHGYLRSCIAAVSNSCGNVSHGLEYGYDELQRPISRNADSFGYNVRGEVVSATIEGRNESHSYDDIGNAVQASYPASTNDYTSNCRNQYSSIAAVSEGTQLVASVSYDLDGNMTRHGEWTYVYDSGNRLVSVASNGITVATMSYDTQGRRVKKVAADGTHRYFYDGWLLVYEHIVRPNSTTSEVEYVWGKDVSGTRDGAAGIGGLLYLKLDGVIYVPWCDAYGNIIGYYDVQGNVVAIYTYDTFGNIISQSGAMIDVFAFRFSTKYFDADCGLYYYGYRHYKPLILRWLTEDPLEENGWVNLYAFNSNSPVHVVDILGLKPQTQCQKNGVLIELLFNGLTLSGSGFSTAAASGRPIAVNITSWVSSEKILGSPAFGGIYTEYTFDYSAKRQHIKNEGPTPEGTYWIEVNEKRSARTSTYSHVIKRKGWGDFSWSLHPDESTQTFGRGGFFIHGGFNWGSAGCIDIKEGDAKLNEFLSGLCDCYIPVKVNYAVKQNKLSEREITWHYTIALYGVPFIR